MSASQAAVLALTLAASVVVFIGIDAVAYYEGGDSLVAEIVAEQADEVRRDD